MSLRENLLDGEQDATLSHFNVKQVHLGFCPEDVIFEIREKCVALCDDDRLVVSYPFTNLVMWSQHQDRVMLMTQDNLRRILIRTRSSRDAKKIAKGLTDQAQVIKANLEKREKLGLDGAGMDSSTPGGPPSLMGSKDAVKSVDMTTSSDDNHAPMLDFRDEVGADLEEFRAYQVEQKHLLKSVCADNIVVLRIDRIGLKLNSRYTGEEFEQIAWFELLMWRTDDSAVILVTTGSNKQIRLLTAAAEDVMRTLVQYSKSVRESMALRSAQVGFRKELLKFKPVKFKTQDAWSKARKQGGLMSKLPWGNTENLAESLQTRDQLHAVFAMHDRNASGTLDSTELMVLLKSLHMDIQRDDLVEIMDEMEADSHREVGFDNFVKWVLSSDKGAEASTTLRRRIAHKKKEVDALLAQFEQIDEDDNGTMDKHEFAELLGHMGLSLNDQELEYTWRTIDQNGSGEIDFEEFVAWFKGEDGDGVSKQMRRVLRLTTILTAAKAALVYAVDPGNRGGKKALKDLFDCLDDDGSTTVGADELMLLVEDLHIDSQYTDIVAALTNMDTNGDRVLDFEEFTQWWCGSSRGPAGTLRSKLKLAAFTSKKVGSVLTVVETRDDGVEDAEKYMNELLSAAFTTPSDMEGRSLGIFGIENPLRRQCHAMITSPYTDRVLLALIFGNVGLIAVQTPGTNATMYLSLANLVVMVIFSCEMGIRIIANGFYFGESAYMMNSWNVFDFIILSAVWLAYVAALFLDIGPQLSSSLVMLRSLRALRFFAHIRNILSSIVAGRSMLMAVILLLLFIFLLFYVIGHQMYSGVFTVRCATIESNCSWCGEEMLACPDSVECANGNEKCFRISPNITYGLRAEHTDKYGFDSFGQALLSLSIVVTLDDWREIGNEFRKSDLLGQAAAWPIFAAAVVALGLFTVNLFAASLAYSYIKVRKQARNLEAANATKKNLVERILVDKTAAKMQEMQARHYLQALNPGATRQARHILKHPAFNACITWVVAINISCMAGVSFNMPPSRALFFEIAEATFTIIYTCEMLIKLQALGFKQYFSVLLNRLDFIIVSASLTSYVIQIFGSGSRAKSSAVFRLLRLLKLFRAARIAKLIFRNAHIKEMVARAFAGIESLMSLVVFITFALCLAAIAGMNLLHDCSDLSTDAHSPSFANAFQSLVVVFQVFTADSWGQVMYNTIDCAGYSAAVFFVSIVCICYFVLGNLFVAIFMENLEIDDDEKRDKQVLAYMESVAMGEDGPQSALGELHHAMDSVSAMLTESSSYNVLQRKGPGEFMKAARLVGTGVKKTGKGIGKLAMKKVQTENTCTGRGGWSKWEE